MHAEHAYLFRHTLMHEVAYQLQLPQDRGRIHSVAIEIIEALFEDNLESMAVELADHARGAINAGLDKLGVECRYLLMAADAAEQDYQQETAEHLLLRLREYHSATHGAVASALLIGVCATQGKLEEALIHYEQVRHEALPEELLFKLHKSASAALLNSGRAKDAVAVINEALQHFDSWLTLRQRAEYLSQRGHCYTEQGETQKAIEDFQRALDLASELNEPAQLVTAYSGIIPLWNSTGRVEKAALALPPWERSIADCDNETVLARGLINFANDAMRRSDLETAHAYLTKAVDLCRRLGMSVQAATAQNNLGTVELHQNRPEQALPRFHDAEQLAREAGSPIILQSTLMNIAVIQANAGEFEQAAETFRDCLDAAKQIGNITTIARSHRNLSQALDKLGRLDEAIDVLNESVEYLSRGGVESSLDAAFTAAQRAYLYSKRGDRAETDRMIEEFNRLATLHQLDRNSPSAIVQSYFDMLDEAQG